MWIAFFLKSPSELSWIIALLLVEKSITFNCATVYQSLCIRFSWFCSFHSESIPGGLSSSHGIPPVHYSFEHNSIPSPAYTTTCSAIPQLKGMPSFSSLLPLQRAQLKIFLHKSFSLWSLWGTNPASILFFWGKEIPLKTSYISLLTTFSNVLRPYPEITTKAIDNEA